MEKLSWAARGRIVILLGCCFILGSAVMLYRGDVGHGMSITRKSDPIFFWIQLAITFAIGVYITRLGVYTRNRADDGEN